VSADQPTPVRARIDELTAEVEQWRGVAESDGSAAYGDCCTLVEAWQRERPADQRGPEGTLTGWIEWAAERLGTSDAAMQDMRRDMEIERMRLAACGVAAMCNTRHSAHLNSRKMLPEYRSASLDDVKRMVLELIMLREESEALAAVMAGMQPVGEVTVEVSGTTHRVNHEFEAVLMLPPGATKLYAAVMFQPVTSWEPIASAPKDQAILLRWPGRRTPCVGSWCADANARKPAPYWSGDTDRWVGTRETRKNQPTHWMPLPA